MVPRSRTAIAAVAIAALFAARLSASDFWLTLNPFVVTSGEWAIATIGQGDAFPMATVPMDARQIDRIVIVRPQGTRTTNDQWNLRPELLKYLAFDVHLSAKQAGTAVVAVSTKQEYAKVGPKAFTNYLRSVRLDAIVAERQRRGEGVRSGRERFTVQPKALMRVGTPPADAPSQAVRAVGAPLVLEIVPARDPYTLKAGDPLPVQVLFRGAPVADAPVVATHVTFRGRAGEYAWSGRTDPTGRASIPLTAAGQWLVRAVHMRRIDGDPKADWESVWASLNFELR
jgi:uncharacterized GH25 family protein